MPVIFTYCYLAIEETILMKEHRDSKTGLLVHILSSLEGVRGKRWFNS
jgi:hypothetical protein